MSRLLLPIKHRSKKATSCWLTRQGTNSQGSRWVVIRVSDPGRVSREEHGMYVWSDDDDNVFLALEGFKGLKKK